MFITRYKHNIQVCGLAAVLLGLLTSLTPLTSSGQIRTVIDSTAYQFWYSDIDARSAALANATIADPRNESGIFTNPALIVFQKENTGMGVHTSYNGSQKTAVESITVPVSLTSGKNIMVGATFHHQVRSPSQVIQNNQLSFSQYMLDIAYAQSLIETLSLGIKLRSYYGITKTNRVWSNNASVGLLYSPSPLVSYGIVYRGTGFQNNWLGSGIVYHRIGPNDVTEASTIRLPQQLELGASLRFPSISEYPDFVLSFSNEKLFGEAGLVYRGGLEIYLKNTVVLRGGYFHSPVVQGGRMGLGLLMSPVKINYAYAPTNLDHSGRTHHVSISINF